MTYDMLSGVRVIELSMYAFAPAATAVLSDWGADVIKIVQPTLADPMMGTPIAGLPQKEVGVAFMWELLNRGKRSVAVDIKTDQGHAILEDLVRRSDVFITNLLPGARTRLGVDPEDLFAINDQLIYARATGHGPEGPEREQGGFDHTDFWARTGIAHAASMVSDEFVPQPIPAMGDLTAGACMAGSIAAALYRRSRTRQHAIVDVSLLSAGTWVAGPGLMASRLYDVDAIPRRRHADLPNPFVGAYRTRDGREIYLAGILTEGHFEEFCAAVERPDLRTDPRFESAAARVQHTRECIAALDELFAQRDLADWRVLLQRLSLPWTIVQTAGEAAVDPQVVANNFLVEIEGTAGTCPVVASPGQFDGRPPSLTRAPDHGEHTEEVLLELGRSWDDIVALKDAGAIL